MAEAWHTDSQVKVLILVLESKGKQGSKPGNLSKLVQVGVRQRIINLGNRQKVRQADNKGWKAGVRVEMGLIIYIGGYVGGQGELMGMAGVNVGQEVVVGSGMTGRVSIWQGEQSKTKEWISWAGWNTRGSNFLYIISNSGGRCLANICLFAHPADSNIHSSFSSIV